MRISFDIKSFFVFLMVCSGLTALAFAETFGAFTGQINANGINVRVDSSVGSEVICVLAKSELVEVVGEAYDWYRIRLPQGAPSYVKKNLLECNNVNSDFATPAEKCLSAKVIKDKVNIRLRPTESAWILGKADKSIVVSIIADEAGWYKIYPVYQSYGWINKKFVNKEILPLVKQSPAILVKAFDATKLSEQLVVEGMVSPYGIVLWRKATHKLTTSENKLYFLKGNRKSLDSLNYRKVKVTGKLASLIADKHPIIQVDSIEVLN